MHRCLAIVLMVAGGALAVSSCSDSEAPGMRGPVAGIRVALARTYYQGVGIELGDSIKVEAVAVDAAGDSVPGNFPIALQSRNPAVAYLDSSDFVHAVRGGQTYIVGSLAIDGATLTDSMMVFAGAPRLGALSGRSTSIDLETQPCPVDDSTAVTT